MLISMFRRWWTLGNLCRRLRVANRAVKAAPNRTAHHDKFSEVVNALEGYKSRKAVHALTAILNDDKGHPLVQAGAASALGRIGTPAAVRALISELPRPHPTGSAAVRVAAANGLGCLHAFDAVGSLEGCLNLPGADIFLSPNSLVASAAAEALARIYLHGPGAWPKAVRHTNVSVRRAAAKHFLNLDVQLRGEWVPDALSELTRDSDALVCRYSAQALGNLGDARAFVPLVKAWQDYCNDQLISALVNLKDMRAVGVLVKWLEKPSPGWSGAIVSGLESLLATSSEQVDSALLKRILRFPDEFTGVVETIYREGATDNEGVYHQEAGDYLTKRDSVTWAKTRQLKELAHKELFRRGEASNTPRHDRQE